MKTNIKNPNPRGFTLMEVILTIGLLAIFGVFALEFLTSAWMGTEKDFSRIKCVIAAENLIEMSTALGIASSSAIPNDKNYPLTMILGNRFDAVPLIPSDIATWTLIAKDSAAHPDGVGSYLALATPSTAISTYTLMVGDAYLANVVNIQTAHATSSVTIDYKFKLGL